MQNPEKLLTCGSEIGTTLTESLRRKVCGQVVRSVRDQVDRCELVGRVIIRLYSQQKSRHEKMTN